MKKSELIQRLQKQFSYMPQADEKDATQTILDAISEAIATVVHKVEIRGFGSFNAHIRPPADSQPQDRRKVTRGCKSGAILQSWTGSKEKS